MAVPFIAWAGLAALNAALAASKAAQARKQRETEAKIRAAEIEAAPWTGKAPTTQVSTPISNLWTEMAGAGINTLGQAAALQGAGLFKEGAAQAATEAATQGATQAAAQGAAQTMPKQDLFELATQNQTLMPPSPPSAMQAFDPSQQASFMNPLQSKRNLWMQMYGK